MSEVLSQAEIDALLEGISKGEIEADAHERKTYRAYDFRRPTKFSKDNLRTLHFLHETFARQLSSSLAGYLRTNARCVLDSVEQVTYEEFLRSLPTPTLVCICYLGVPEKPVVMEMSLSLTFGIIDRILGGPGIGGVQERELTEIEQAIIEEVLTLVLVELSKAWSTVVEAEFHLEKMEAHPQFVQVVFPTEIILAVSMEAEVGASEGFINFCFPFTSLQELLDGFNTEKWLSSRPKEEGSRRLAVKEDLSSVKAPIGVELGRAHISLADLRNLKEGQVIRLDARVDDAVVVKIGKTPAYYAWPGTSRGRMAVRIHSRIDPDEAD
ncbi:MAG: flagellar motor switch protein FliM [Actinobacteria bacterium]|nr:flagellar motor switch protein FliM [Actinomycetota bacterium]